MDREVDVAGRVDVVLGPARDGLAKIADESIDAIFIDADKQSYSHYLAEAVRIVRPQGLVLVDNAFAFGQLFDEDVEESVHAIRAINDEIAAHRG